MGDTMNIYRYVITRRDNTEEPKIVYLFRDTPIDGKILICINAGIRASDFPLYSVDVSKVEIPERCTSNLEPYLAWHEKSDRLAEAGETQSLCTVCERWKWQDERCTLFTADRTPGNS